MEPEAREKREATRSLEPAREPPPKGARKWVPAQMQLDAVGLGAILNTQIRVLVY